MEVWLTGAELLQRKYNGDKVKMFADIQSGKIVPRTYFERIEDSAPVLPKHIKESPLLWKVAKMEATKERLEADDEKLLRWQCIHDTGDEPNDVEFREYLQSPKGKEIQEKIAKRRPEWKEEYEELYGEIGDPDKALAPETIWKGVEFTPQLQRMLLEADYLTETGNGDKGQGEKKSSNKEKLASLKDKERELQKVEKDKDVRAARLYDEFGAKYWMIVKIFDIELSSDSRSKDPQKDKEQKARRMAIKGRNIQRQRQKIK